MGIQRYTKTNKLASIFDANMSNATLTSATLNSPVIAETVPSILFSTGQIGGKIIGSKLKTGTGAGYHGFASNEDGSVIIAAYKWSDTIKKPRISYDSGITWSEVSGWTVVDYVDYDLITYGGGTFVIAASGTQDIRYSVDNGLSWTSATLPTSLSWNSIAYFKHINNSSWKGFILTATGSNNAAYSIDGITWSLITLPLNGGTGYGWQILAVGKYGILLCTENTSALKLAWSNDLSYWEPVTTGYNYFDQEIRGVRGTYKEASSGWGTFYLPYGNGYHIKAEDSIAYAQEVSTSFGYGSGSKQARYVYALGKNLLVLTLKQSGAIVIFDIDSNTWKLLSGYSYDYWTTGISDAITAPASLSILDWITA